MAAEREKEKGAGVVAGDTLFRVVAESASDAILTIDRDSFILFANEAAGRIFGYRRNELLGKSLTMLMPEFFRSIHQAAVDRYIETGERRIHWGGIELPGLHRSGREIPVEVSFGETVESGEHLFTGIVRDISERKRTERRWEAQYGIARTLAEARSLEEASVPILESLCTSLDWTVAVLWRPGPATGRLHPVATWCDPKADAGAFLKATRESSFERGRGLPGRVWLTEEPAWIDDIERDEDFPRLKLVDDAGLHGALALPIANEDEFIGVMEFFSPDVRQPDESVIRMLQSTAVQIGQFIRRQRIAEEVRTLNRELEERVVKRTAQLEESRKELEAFTYSVSHDLRAPLRGVDGFSQLLLDDLDSALTDEARGYLLRIQKAAKRMGELIDDLLDLSRISGGRLDRNPVDLGSIARQVVEGLQQRDPARRVEFVLESTISVNGDARLLRIALENMLENAWKFTRHKERPCVEFGVKILEGEKVCYVRDNGAGFDMRYADKLFDPFQRLHSPGEFEGTGIGLATVQRIIRRHGGRVWAEAEPGAGATFYFTLGEGGRPLTSLPDSTPS